MSITSSTLSTSHVLDNEIIKASDFEFAFQKIAENIALATQMMLESEQDFVINGVVVPYNGMNVKVSPIYGVCKSTGIPFGRTEITDESIPFESTASGRVDIIEVQGDWATYDNQQRAFNDPDTDTQTYQYVDTKKYMYPNYQVKQGVEGSSVAPEVDTGWVKLAEVVIRANASEILESDIKNITSDVAGLANEEWTTETTATYNIGYISDVNRRFRMDHNEDGSHKDDVIDTDSLNIGIGTKQVNGNVLPVGGAVSIPEQSISSTDSILSVLTKAAAMITTLYNAYLKFGTYGFNGELSVSSLIDANNDLVKALKIIAAGDGTARIQVDGSDVITIDANGKLSTNGYTATSSNHIVTKSVTDAISLALSNLTTRVDNIEATSDVTQYSNGVLSAGTNGRYNVDSTSIYVATTENITLSSSQTIDGVTPTDGVYILVKDQTDKTENGIYQYSSSSTWARVNDYATPSAIKAKIFDVTNGTTNSGKMFYLPKVNFVDAENFGTDDIEFSEYMGSVKALASKTVVRDTSGHVKAANSANSADCTTRAEFLTKDSAMAQIILNYVYPVGSLYWSSDSTNPGTLFGGTWTQIKDVFVLAAGDTYSNGDVGGEPTHTLTVSEIPSHNHSVVNNQIGGKQSLSTNTTSGGYSYVNNTGAISIGYTGGDQAHNNMPPYIVKYCWERTA